MQALALDGNQLSGPIPPELAALPRLAALYLADNPISGCIPPALHDLLYNDLDDLSLPDCPP